MDRIPDLRVGKFQKICVNCDELTVNFSQIEDSPLIYCNKDFHEIKDADKETCEHWNIELSLEFGMGFLATEREKLDIQKNDSI